MLFGIICILAGAGISYYNFGWTTNITSIVAFLTAAIIGVVGLFSILKSGRPHEY
jgi:Na+-translocating ferredoxin:NAD+ oxidoreductase RnfD subunit